MPKANNCRQKTQKCVLFIIAFLLLCFYIPDEDSHYFPTKTKTLLTSVHSGLYASSSSLHSFPCFSLFHDNTLCFPASTYPTKTLNIFFVKLVSSHSSIHKLYLHGAAWDVAQARLFRELYRSRLHKDCWPPIQAWNIVTETEADFYHLE